MQLNFKVTLLSLLVFPGVGHLMLKKYAIGISFITIFAYLLIGLIKDLHTKTQQIVDSIIRGEIPIDISSIRQALMEQGALENPNIVYGVLVIWVFAALDAYRIANKDIHKVHIADQSS